MQSGFFLVVSLDGGWRWASGVKVCCAWFDFLNPGTHLRSFLRGVNKYAAMIGAEF